MCVGECLGARLHTPSFSSLSMHTWMCTLVLPRAHKQREAAPRNVQLRMIAWNSDVLTTAARLCPYLDRSYITATTEATQVYNYYYSNCPIWSMTGRSKFLFRILLFSVVGCSLVPLRGTYGLLVLHVPVSSMCTCACAYTCTVLVSISSCIHILKLVCYIYMYMYVYQTICMHTGCLLHRDPEFVPRPSLQLAVEYLVRDCVRKYPSEQCPVCGSCALPQDPQVGIPIICTCTSTFLHILHIRQSVRQVGMQSGPIICTCTFPVYTTNVHVHTNTCTCTCTCTHTCTY